MPIPGAGPPIDVVLLFDVEDVFSPPEVGNDDSIREIADILTEENVPGVFLFIADRAEQLQARGRDDVIRSLDRHETGLHTRSARHPCPPEYVANRFWVEGVAESHARETEGAEIIRQVFGRPACAMSTHNVFTSPHAHRTAARLGLPFVYSYAAAPPHYGLSWYCGALCLPWYQQEDGRMNPTATLEWDDYYPEPAAFEKRVAEFDRLIEERRAQGQPFLMLMLYHPQRLRLAEFIDHFFAPNGVNLPPERWGELGEPRRYTEEQVATARANFRHLVGLIRDDPRLRVRTMAQLVARYGGQPATISRSELMSAAAETTRAGCILQHARFSAAELLLGMAEAVVEFAHHGRMPGEVRRVDALGPTENPIIEPELKTCPWPRLVAAAAGCVDSAARTGHLPANFGPTFERFGINHLYLALAGVLPALAEGTAPTDIFLRRTPRCPPEAGPIARRFLAIGNGELVDPDLNIDALHRHGGLQSWTLKPAHATPEP